MKTTSTLGGATQEIINNILANKELSKDLAKVSHYGAGQFADDAKRYIKAIEEGRVICSIGSVSSSGMSRTIKFLAPETRRDGKFQYLNFFAFFLALGFKPSGKYGDYFRIGGCGMDMIFHTNYTIIHRLHRLGMISAEKCAELAQDTPTVI